MKNVLTIIAMMLVASWAQAEVNASGTATVSGVESTSGSTARGGDQSQSQGNTNSVDQGQSQGNVFRQKFDSHAVSHAPDLGDAVGIATAPALTTTLTETCMGSTSLGAGFSGGSFSFGTTWRDTACVRRLDARQIQSMGDVQAAKEIMCDSDLVRGAFKRVGRPCAEDGGSYAPVSHPAPVAEAAPPAPAATAAEVKDDQDLNDQNIDSRIQAANAARAAMRARGY